MQSSRYRATLFSCAVLGLLQTLQGQELFSTDTLSMQVEAIRFDHPPIIDGSVNDDVWRNAQPVTKFLQREPDTGEPFSLATEVYLGYDKEHLYVGFRCFCDPSAITAKEMARDVDLANDDRVQVILDTYLDRRNGYWFQVGPRKSIGDAIISENGAAFNKAWDGLWTGKASMHTEGWDAELAIPFKTMGFEKGLEHWGLKLIRYHVRNQETGYWPSANLNSHKFQVSDAGLLTGLEGISQGLGLDVVPYGLTGVDYSGSPEGSRAVLDAGLETYYNITPGLKAAITINTDFAQTVVDDREINLTRFSLFYPEKRDFFLDGANYFNFGINGDRENPWNTRMIPFFTRRIGLDSAGSPIPVLFGSKVTGQAGQWNIGAMYMKDQRGDWRNSHFAVTRISRNMGEQSQVGLISTWGNAIRDLPALLVGLDAKVATSRFRGDRNLSFTVYGLKSFTFSEDGGQNGSERSLTWGAELLYPNDLVHLRAGHLRIQEDFVAGTGFVPRPGIRQSYGELMVGPRPSRWGILQVLAGMSLDHISDFDGRMLTREAAFTPLTIRFLSGEQVTWEMTSSYEYLDGPFQIYRGHVIPEGVYTSFWHQFQVQSALRRSLWAKAAYRCGGFYGGTRHEARLEAGYKIAVPLFLGGEVIRNDIELEGEGFIASIYRINLNILFSPDITLYNYIQYDSGSDRAGWQSRFRWIIRPGREVFLVWNSIAGDPFDRFRLEESSARLKVKFTLRF